MKIIIQFTYRISSEDDLHLLEIPEPPTIVSKNDDHFGIDRSSAITTDAKISGMKTAPNKSPYHHSQSSFIFENDNVSNHQNPIPSTSTEERGCMNNLKNVVHKLEIVIHIVPTKSMRMKFIVLLFM